MRLSLRTAWPREPSPLAQAIARERAAGRVLVDLTESNPTRAGFLDRAHDIALLGDARGVRYEPSALGMLAAREAIAEYYAARGRAVVAESVVLTASSSEAYGWLFKLLCDPGDVVLAPRPSYPLFPYLADLEGVSLVPYSLLRHERWRIDLGELARSIAAHGDRVKAILLVHPHNPTGAVVHPEDRRALFELCKRHDLAVICDEVFLDYAPGQAGAVSFAGSYGVTCFVLSGLSKVALLPQAKLGWIAVSGPGADEMLERLEVIADTYLSVSTAVQLACPALLQRATAVQGKLAERLAENLAIVDDTVAKIPALSRVSGDAGWYACVAIPRTQSDEAWCEMLLEREGIIVQPGFFFDMDEAGIMVVSLLCERFHDAFTRAARLWAE
jgi:alanine-synthesizing transaminase